MKLNVAVQMDPISGIDISGDSTFALMLEAQRRGHSLFHYHVKSLASARWCAVGTRRACCGAG